MERFLGNLFTIWKQRSHLIFPEVEKTSLQSFSFSNTALQCMALGAAKLCAVETPIWQQTAHGGTDAHLWCHVTQDLEGCSLR